MSLWEHVTGRRKGKKNFTCNLNPFIKLLYKNSHWADFLSAVQGVGVWGGGHRQPAAEDDFCFQSVFLERTCAVTSQLFKIGLTPN